jgi:putative DNA primase/helicase
MQPNGSAARSADTPNISDAESDAEILRLAGLPDLAYGRERKAAGEKLGLSLAWLDKVVNKKKAELTAEIAGSGEGDSGGQGRPINLPDPKPWPHPVDGGALLSAITEAISKFMVMEPGAAECVAMWALHTHAVEAAGITPRMAITSPRPGCGKTTLLDILYRLVVRPLLAGNVSTAAVFRVVEVVRPTLLIDEADTFLPGNDELRGVLNSGHRRGGSVVRIVGEENEPREFSTFSPAAIAMIGNLPGTLADRSIPITLKRKRPDEHVENFRHDRTEELDQLARMCVRWAADNIGRLRRSDPAVPPNLYNRAADNWRPLLAIADAAGGDWPERARGIAAQTVDADQAKRVGLLADIRDVFAERQVDKIKSADLAAALVAIEGHPWAEYGRSGKPLSANSLARALASDHVLPKTVRFGVGTEDTAKGYELKQFADAFARYLPPAPNPTVTPSQTQDPYEFPANSHPSQSDGCYGLGMAQNPSVSTGCASVTVEKPGEPQKSERMRVRL